MVKKLTYAKSDLKEVTAKIYKKPRALINYLIDTFSRERDWVLVLFSGSGKISDITYESIFQVLLFFLFFIKFVFKVFLFMLFEIFFFGD